jgi:hypothetical protein
MNKSQALRFKRLCREAGKELNTKPTAETAIQLATYRLQRSALQAKLIAGRAVDTGQLLQIDAAIKGIQPAAGPLKLEIELVGPSVTMCPKCDHVFNPDSPTATAEKKAAMETPRTFNATAIKSDAKPADAKQLPAPAPAAPVTPPPPPAPPRNPSMAAWERA